MNQVEIKTTLQIAKPQFEVFEAIVDPDKMCNYFISQSSGRMEAGKELMWEFQEFPGAFPVQVQQLKENKCWIYLGGR